MEAALADLARRFESAPYNARLGIRVESVEPERVRVRVPYKDENSNPGRALHGGVAASTIDITGALAARASFGGKAGLEAGTLDLSVSYLAAAIGEDIIADGEVLRRGKELVYCDVAIRNEAGKKIARGMVTYRLFDRAADPAAAERQLAQKAADLPGGSEVPRGASMMTALPFMARLGLSIEHMHGGRSLVRMPFQRDNTDHDDVVHEGAIAALLDTTGAMAAWSVVGLNFQYKASTAGIHVNFHAPVAKEDLVAAGTTLRRNNEIFLNHVQVSGVRSGTVAATGSVTYRIVVGE